ncbi:MAG TPA: peptidoglycan-binding protein [Blastocatellia bacterium]|nr:peptidoglycan-binding protein [Blastocatellia bacterium]
MPSSRRFQPLSIYVALTLTLAVALVAQGQTQRPRVRSTSPGDRSWSVPQGTVVSMRMDSWLNSGTARAGDRFTSTVTIPVYVNGKTVIPAGSIVEGHVTAATPAKRRSQSGTIAVEFDQIVFPNGSRVPLRGSLTATDPKDRGRIDDENRVQGRDENRKVVFIGGGGAIGAVIGGIAGGGKGAAYGGLAGVGAGVAGVLLAKGVEAEVKPGTSFGIQLSEPLSVHDRDISEPSGREAEDVAPATSTRPDPGVRREPPATRTEPPASRTEPVLSLSSPEMIRRAQTALKAQGYYEGQVDGVPGPRTETALKTYQREHNLPETGKLDQRTANSLGITNRAAVPASAPASPPTSAPVSASTPERRVPSRTPDPDTTDPAPNPAPSRGNPTPPAGTPNPAALRDRIDDLLADFRQSVNSGASGSGSSVRYDNGDITCLFALESLSGSATLYASIAPSLNDRGNLRAATLAFAREARRTDAVLTTSDSPAARAVASKWDAIRQEVLRLMQSYGISTSELD